ncbi:hypothetical protein RI129_012829 [Pyrocoelia pectoralis]|uniref:DUF4806 domain-containing protein n=1 Tax=Pyrocoelia pectoralis TaxID=417401 RepID=A0AAN7V733_9COLE
MFTVIEFHKDDGGGLAVVNSQWLTPRKKEVFWPPITNNTKFNKCLIQTEFSHTTIDTETWKLYSVHKIYCECDNLETANHKLKRAQDDSDVNSTAETRKRKRRLPVRLLDSSESDDSNVYCQSKYTRPSPIKRRSIISTPTTSERVNLKSCKYQLLLKEIIKIKEQNKEILQLLKNRTSFTSNSEFPEDFPCTIPISDIKDLDNVEKVLSENPCVAYFSTRGGKDLRTKTNNILRNLMTDELASNHNYYGLLRKDRNDTPKKPFKKLKLNTVVIRSVKHNSDFTTDSIEAAIKLWLKHAPQRKQNKAKLVVHDENM